MFLCFNTKTEKWTNLLPAPTGKDKSYPLFGDGDNPDDFITFDLTNINDVCGLTDSLNGDIPDMQLARKLDKESSVLIKQADQPKEDLEISRTQARASAISSYQCVTGRVNWHTPDQNEREKIVEELNIFLGKFGDLPEDYYFTLDDDYFAM